MAKLNLNHSPGLPLSRLIMACAKDSIMRSLSIAMLTPLFDHTRYPNPFSARMITSSGTKSGLKPTT